MIRKGEVVLLLMLFLAYANVTAQDMLKISVQSDKPGVEIQAAMWGVFFEDINFAADGGIYAELVKNRSFEFELPMSGWQVTSNQNGTGRTVPNSIHLSNLRIRIS